MLELSLTSIYTSQLMSKLLLLGIVTVIKNSINLLYLALNMAIQVKVLRMNACSNISQLSIARSCS